MSPKIVANAAAIDEQFRKSVLNFYRQQRGGGALLNFPVYRGAEYQYGNGIGDIFRSIARFLVPILVPTAAEFIRTTGIGLQEGKTFKDAAKASLPHTITKAIESGLGEIRRRGGDPSDRGQMGSGRRGPLTRSVTVHPRKRKRSATQNRVYKEAKRKRFAVKSLRYLNPPTNF